VKFSPLSLQGAFVVELEPIPDERGFFARTFCGEEFAAHGCDFNFVQSSVSFNKRKGTLRGMHYQKKPHEEAKVVRCVVGAIYDVVVDLRPESTTFKCWVGVELSAGNRKAIYIPKGFAHGFLTLADDTEVYYQMASAYHPDSAGGVRWDDPAFSIQWPFQPEMISSRDAAYPLFSEVAG